MTPGCCCVCGAQGLVVACEWDYLDEPIAWRCAGGCAGCPVIAPCLEEALRRDEHGFWGGLTEAERAQIRGRKARVGNKAADPLLEQAMAEAREARRGRGA